MFFFFLCNFVVTSFNVFSVVSQPPPNINSIGEVYNSLGTKSLTLFVGYHWATG